MSEFEEQLRSALSEEDSELLKKTTVSGYYQEVFHSFKGPDAAISIFAWSGILAASALLIFFLIKAFMADQTSDQILFAALAVMLNSAQIAIKLWFNMRLNRRAILRELGQLRLDLLTARK